MVSLSAALMLVTLAAVEIRSQPDHLLGSGSAPVNLTVRGAPADAEITVTTNAGTVEKVTRTADGVAAQLRPPTQRYPQVALILVEVKTQAATTFHWHAIPVHGVSELQLQTKKNARVAVQVGSRAYDNLTADSGGHLKLSIEVPPGVDFAEMVSVDHIGNRTKTRLPLTPPPFPRARAALSVNAPSWADAQPASVEVFAVNRDGTPLAKGAPLLSVTKGAVIGAAKLLRPGVFGVSYRAPEKVADGAVVLEAWVANDPKRSSLMFSVIGGPPVRLELTAPAEYTAGTPPPNAEIRGFDAKGNAAAPKTPVALRSCFGSASFELSQRTAALPLADAFEGRKDCEVSVVSGDASAKKTLALVPAAPASGVLRVEQPKLRAGEDELHGEVTLVDAFGNPVPSESLSAELAGARADMSPRGDGRYSVRLQTPDDAPAGEGAAVVRASNGLQLTSPLTILPYRKSFGLSAGLVLGGQTNLGAVIGGSPSLELAARAGRSPLELVLRAGAGFHPAALTAHPQNPDASLRTELSTYSASLGARFGLALGGRFELAFSAAGGAVYASYTRTLVGASEPYSERGNALSPVGIGALGVHCHLGPGRLIAEGAFALARVQTGSFAGALGGPSINVGYLFKVR